MKIANRLQKLRLKLAQQELDAILISQPENRYYLSGFNGSAGFLLITEQKAVLATDFRYTEQAKIQAPEYDIFQTSGNTASWFPEMINGLNLRRLGLEAENITLTTYRQLTGAIKKLKPKPALISVNSLVESLRSIKDAEEIEFITKASELADNAMEYVRQSIHSGLNEKELAWEIEQFMRRNGSQPVPFEVIVASGPNSAMPHARPSLRRIQPGEPVVVDIGARINGYCSDLTRTICLGQPDDAYNKVYEIVLNAQITAINGIKEGMTGDGADKLARAVIERAGHGEAFGHSLGHGVGLVPHEQPRLGPKSTDKLTPGMVFSIEPGVYLNGWGGIRIEDLVVIENGETRVISKSRKGGST
ncbi:M24 family metallopeptidase [Chloroflexota bacterium]